MQRRPMIVLRIVSGAQISEVAISGGSLAWIITASFFAMTS
jgi:hypothetical protein